MKRCPKCNCENVPGNMYCERCGTLLPNSDAHSFTDPTYNSSYEAQPSAPTYANTYEAHPSVSTEYGPPPSILPPPPLAVPSPRSSYEAASSGRPRKRSIGAAILSSIFYLFGIFCFALGSINLQPVPSTNTNSSFLFLCIVLLGIIGLVLLLIFHPSLSLQWWLRTLYIIGLTVLALMALMMTNVIYPYKGLLLMIYGFLTAIVAFW